MNNKEKIEGAYNVAIEKFSLYLITVYELLNNKTMHAIAKSEAAKNAWKNAIKEYNNLLSSLAKQGYFKK